MEKLPSTSHHEGEKRSTTKRDATVPVPMADQTDFSVEGGRRSGFTKESRWWDIYNNEAEKVDQELIKDWRESLNGLLLFAAIFAAVLTAFIIESKKMLEEDPASLMLEVMIFYTNNRSNDTHTLYEKPDFEATATTVSINCLLFASLGASLVAALASVIALQWVADYDAAITRGGDSPLDRAKRRQFRFAGVDRWKIAPIIEALPIIIFIGVVFFFVGLIQWILEINRTVGFIVVSGAAIAALFYSASTIIAVVSAASPFRTPPARWIYSLFHALLKLQYHIFEAASLKTIAEWIRNHYPTITDKARGRDDRGIKANPQLEYDAYLWVSRQVSTSQESYGRWIVLLSELLNWSPAQLDSIGFLDGPWMKNLTAISQYYYENLCTLEHTLKDCNNIATLTLVSQIEQIHQEIKEPTPYQQDKSASGYWDQYCLMAIDNLPVPSDSPHPLFLLKRDLPTPSLGSASEVKTVAQLSKWCNSMRKDPDVWQDILSRGDTCSSLFMENALTMLLEYIPQSKWTFRDNEKQRVCTSLFSELLKRSTDETLHPHLISLTVRAFGLLVCPKFSYDCPVQYATNILDLPIQIKVLHASVTLIQARSLKSCPREMLPHRLKEVIAMLWLYPDESLSLELSENWQLHEIWYRTTISELYDLEGFKGWPRRVESLICVPEILECMVLAQNRYPDFGPLWYPRNVSLRDFSLRVDPFTIFDKYIGSAITAVQYHAVIATLCQGLEDPSVRKQPIHGQEQKALSKLSDPCVQFLRCRFLGIPAPAPAVGIKPEFLGITERLVGKDLSETTSALAWELWVFVWSQFSTHQKRTWCREARNKPNRIVYLTKMGAHPVMLGLEYDAPINLWRRLLEADFDSEDQKGEINTGAMVRDARPLFEGKGLQDKSVSELLACLLYTRNDGAQQLYFPWAVREYIGHIWRLCEAVQANRSLMLTHLIEVFIELIRRGDRFFECAIILKLLQDGFRDKGLYIIQLRSLIEVLRRGFRSEIVDWRPVMNREASETVHRLLIEIQYRGALAWPRGPNSNHPVRHSLGIHI